MLTSNTTDHILTPELATKIDLCLAAHNTDASQLIGILLDVQDAVPAHYIPKEVAYYLAEKLDLKISVIYDVISFYSSLSDQPRAKYPIQICNSIVCKVNQSDTIFAVLEELLGIGLNEVTYDGRFTLESVPCFGACDIAPAVRINGNVYGHLDSKEKIENLLNTLI